MAPLIPCGVICVLIDKHAAGILLGNQCPGLGWTLEIPVELPEFFSPDLVTQNLRDPDLHSYRGLFGRL